jgi:hypothetical protein
LMHRYAFGGLAAAEILLRNGTRRDGFKLD